MHFIEFTAIASLASLAIAMPLVNPRGTRADDYTVTSVVGYSTVNWITGVSCTSLSTAKCTVTESVSYTT
jgi:hypothetical protein